MVNKLFLFVPYTLLLGTLLAFFYGFDQKIQRNEKIYKSWFFYCDPVRLIAIFLIASSGLAIYGMDGFKSLGKKDWLIMILSSFTDYTAIFSMAMAFRSSPGHYVFALNQTTFIFNALVMKIRGIPGLPTAVETGIVSFVIFIYFFYSASVQKSDKSNSLGYLKSTFWGALAACSFTCCIQIQHIIVGKSGVSVYHFVTSPICLVFSFLYSVIVDYKNIPKSMVDVKRFYKHNLLYVFASCIPGAIFYFMAGHYIAYYSPLNFNVCNLAFPSYVVISDLVSFLLNRKQGEKFGLRGLDVVFYVGMVGFVLFFNYSLLKPENKI